MLQTRSPGPFHLTAQNWNEIALAVNAVNAGSPALGATGGTLYAQAAADVDANMPVQLTTLINDAQLSVAEAPRPVVLTAAPLTTAKPALRDLFLGVALAPAPSGSVFPVAVAGVVMAQLASGHPAHADTHIYYDESTGELKGGAAGPWLRVPTASASNEAGDGSYMVLPGRLPNMADASTSGTYTYTIDRTDSADDAKSWDPYSDPSNPAPSDFADYAAVELITATLRSDGSSVELVKTRQIWAAPNAPVIPALASGDVEDPSEEFQCENAGGGA